MNSFLDRVSGGYEEQREALRQNAEYNRRVAEMRRDAEIEKQRRRWQLAVLALSALSVAGQWVLVFRLWTAAP